MVWHSIPRRLRWLILLSLIGIPGGSRCDEPAARQDAEQVDGLAFREPFEVLSPRDAEKKMVVLLITDEDPQQWTAQRLAHADKNRIGGGPDVWCGDAFRQAFKKLFESRPDLKGKCIAQRLVAGLPSNLTARAKGRVPSRAMVAIGDGQYRLLEFCVGVPRSDELLGLIEDAQENQSLLRLHEDNPEKVGRALITRSQERIQRVYRDALNGLQDQYEWDKTLFPIDDAWVMKYGDLITDLRPSYFFDVKLRFGLTDSSDLARLLVLEQHCEARADWCDSVIPYVVGRPMQDIVRPLVESVWEMPASFDLAPDDHTDVLQWFADRRAAATVVLSLRPHLLARRTPWPPRNLERSERFQQDWRTLEQVMSRHAFRTVSAEELSVLLRENEEASINLLSPSPVRYVFFEATSKKPWVIRESDTPGKFIKRLKKGLPD